MLVELVFTACQPLLGYLMLKWGFFVLFFQAITYFQIFLSEINNFQTAIWPIGGIQRGTTSPDQSGPESYDRVSP